MVSLFAGLNSATLVILSVAANHVRSLNDVILLSKHVWLALHFPYLKIQDGTVSFSMNGPIKMS